MKKRWYTSIMLGEFPVIPAVCSIIGVILFYVGINMAYNNWDLSNLCSSVEGRVAQDVSGVITAQCSSASHDVISGIVLGVVGAGLAILGSTFVKKGRSEFRAGRRDVTLATPAGAPSTAPYGTAPVRPGPAPYAAATATAYAPGAVGGATDGPPAPAVPKLRGGLAAPPGRGAAPTAPAPAPSPAPSPSMPVDPGYGVPTAPDVPSYSASPPAPAPGPGSAEVVPPPGGPEPPPDAPAPPKPQLKGRLAPPPGSDGA